MNLKRLKINDVDLIIGVKEISEKCISQSLRLNCSKKRSHIINELLVLAGVELRKCNFCDKTVDRYKFTFQLVNENEIKINGIRYLDELYYCAKSECPGKKLNPNSVEFVSKSLKLSVADALKHIKARNKSPFYLENHESIEAYQKYQNIYDREPDKRVELIQKQNYARSLDGYIDRYGEEAGTKRWKLIQSQKKITVENLLRKHTFDEATDKIKQWKLLTRHNLDNFIKRHGDVKGKAKYLEYVRKVTSHRRSRISLDGFEFYSSYEVMFYQALKRAGFNWPWMHDMHYPGSAMRSDFYFPMIDVHVELAFSYFMPGYASKMKLKEDLFKPIIITSAQEYDIIISKLIDDHRKVIHEN